ncbi:GNAT family N-acetyltransferase [Actinomycetes bacterium KLBMP 9759]
MTAAGWPHVVRLRSNDLVCVRQVRPADADGLADAYTNLGEQSRYRRFFTLLPELPDSVLRAATEVDHVDHEALVAEPLLRPEIVGECRFVRSAERPDTADFAVTVVDGWQGRGLGSALLERLSERALELGVEYFTAEVLAENRTMLAMLDSIGAVETESHGSTVSARIEIADRSGPRGQQLLLRLLAVAASGQAMCVPAPLRKVMPAIPDDLAHLVLLPVSAVLGALTAGRG